MTQYTDEETARQLEALLNVIKEGTETASEVLKQAQAVQEQLSQDTERTQKELQQSLAEARELTSQVVEGKRKFSQFAQQIEENITQILQVRSALQQLHQEVVLAVNDIGGQQGLEKLRNDYQEVRRRVNEIQELMSTTQSALVTQAISQVEQAQKRIQQQEEQVVNQIRTLVSTALTEFGGQAGLERLRQELQQGHQILGEIQGAERQLQSSIAISLTKVQEMLQAHSAIQETVSKLETVRSEVSELARQVKLDREAINTPENQNHNLAIALRREMERQQRELQKLQALVYKQQQIRNWLFVIVFTTASVALTLALAK
jgi:DNA repair exonuclease SbcCD ATPase subunit